MEFISPRSLHSKGSKPIVCLVNVSDTSLNLKQGHVIGIATEIQDIIGKQLCENFSVQKVTPSKEVHEIPEHLQELLTKSGEHLSSQEKVLLQDVLLSYSDVFAQNEFDLGNFTAIEHNIDTGDAAPIKQRLLRTPACYVGEEEKHLNKLLDAGVIEPSISEWASAPVLVRKKDGTLRWCVDYRALNKVTKKDVFPLPLVDECLDTLTGNVWFSKLDANWAYLQVKVKDSDKEMDEHLPSLIHPPSRKRVRSSSTMSSATSAEMCRDVRLHSNPELPIIQENAAKSECPSSSGVCEAADTSNVTVTFHTADEVDGSNSNKRRRCVIDDECIVTCTSSSSSSLQKCPFPGCNKRERKIK